MNSEQIAELINALGTDGINAFYVYLAVDYAFGFTLLALSVWGIRTAWRAFKKREWDMDDD